MSFKFTSSAVCGCVKIVQVCRRVAAGETAFFPQPKGHTIDRLKVSAQP